VQKFVLIPDGELDAPIPSGGTPLRIDDTAIRGRTREPPTCRRRCCLR
jgi:hypothetical protein